MRNAEFKTKEEYLQYKKDWKAEYKELSLTIREKKILRKENSRIFNKGVSEKGSPGWENPGLWRLIEFLTEEKKKSDPKYKELTEKYKDDRRWLEDLSCDATLMLEELKESKREAQRQYLASKNLQPVEA
jgi:hypothetical protein